MHQKKKKWKYICILVGVKGWRGSDEGGDEVLEKEISGVVQQKKSHMIQTSINNCLCDFFFFLNVLNADLLVNLIIKISKFFYLFPAHVAVRVRLDVPWIVGSD